MGEEVFNRIRDYRVEHGLTQDELAQNLALRFAQYFQCSTDELFKLNEEDQHVK
jgi:DNA-binding XRE family transcriptional regulator